MTVTVAERPPFDAAVAIVWTAEKRCEFAIDDSLPGGLHRSFVGSEDEPECPRGKRRQ